MLGYSLSLTIDTAQLQSVEAEVIYLDDVEFVFEKAAESAADEIVSGELDFVEEV